MGTTMTSASIPGSVSLGRAALLGGGIVAGGALGYLAISATRDNPGGRTVASWLTLGGGVAGAIGGYALAKAAYQKSSVGGMLGVAMLAVGIGAVIGGGGGLLTIPIDVPQIATPVVKPPTSNPGGTTNPGETPTPPTAAASASAVLGALDAHTFVAQHTTDAERVLLAAAALQAGADGSAAATAFQQLSQDKWAGQVLAAGDRVMLVAAALEKGRSGAEAATTFANIDAAVDEGGAPVTKDLEDQPHLRAVLAAAAIRGDAIGEDAAFKYGNISIAIGDRTSVHERVTLTAAALEGAMTASEAVAAFEQVNRHAVTHRLSTADRVKLAAGALRGSAPASAAIDAYKVISADEWAGKVLTPSLIATLAATAAQEGVSGNDALLTFVNAAADEYTFNEAPEYDQLVQLAVGGIEGKRTGAEAATAFVNVSANERVYDTLDVNARFQLAAAALSTQQATGRDVAAAYERIRGDASLRQTSPMQDALLAVAMVKGFDADSSSQLLDWYLAAVS